MKERHVITVIDTGLENHSTYKISSVWQTELEAELELKKIEQAVNKCEAGLARARIENKICVIESLIDNSWHTLSKYQIEKQMIA